MNLDPPLPFLLCASSAVGGLKGAAGGRQVQGKREAGDVDVARGIHRHAAAGFVVVTAQVSGIGEGWVDHQLARVVVRADGESHAASVEGESAGNRLADAVLPLVDHGLVPADAAGRGGDVERAIGGEADGGGPGNIKNDAACGGSGAHDEIGFQRPRGAVEYQV